jgi:deoxyribonuclease-1
MIYGEQRVYGQCDAQVNFKSKAFEPAKDIRGNIARTYFYFEKEYTLKLSKKQRQLYTAWDIQDPVDAADCRVHSLKEKKQGQPNPFVKSQCAILKI